MEALVFNLEEGIGYSGEERGVRWAGGGEEMEGRKKRERKENRWYIWLVRAGLGAGNADEIEESDMLFLNGDSTGILNKSLLYRTI